MGMGGISIWQLLIILVIVLLLFGTKKLKNIGADLGGAVRGFRSAMGDGDKGKDDDAAATPADDGPVAGRVEQGRDDQVGSGSTASRIAEKVSADQGKG